VFSSRSSGASGYRVYRRHRQGENLWPEERSRATGGLRQAAQASLRDTPARDDERFIAVLYDGDKGGLAIFEIGPPPPSVPELTKVV